MCYSEFKEAKKEILHRHDLAVRLIEGGIVEYDGLCVKAIPALDPEAPCLECHMDSACTHKLMALCSAVDEISGAGHCLTLVTDVK